jgi:predicted neutral ceramidase superfamily lipid hydrolase
LHLFRVLRFGLAIKDHNAEWAKRGILMVKANIKIVARWPVKHRDTTGLPEESVPASPFSRWISFLILIPVILAAMVLAVFFFSVFLALFLIAGSVLSLWMWWLRRKWRRAVPLEGLQGGNAIIKEIRSVETEMGKKSRINKPDKDNWESLCQ